MKLTYKELEEVKQEFKEMAIVGWFLASLLLGIFFVVGSNFFELQEENQKLKEQLGNIGLVETRYECKGAEIIMKTHSTQYAFWDKTMMVSGCEVLESFTPKLNKQLEEWYVK